MDLCYDFICDGCGGRFHSDRPNEEAEQEMYEMFGNIPKEDRKIVCDGCWKKGLEAIGRMPISNS